MNLIRNEFISYSIAKCVSILLQKLVRSAVVKLSKEEDPCFRLAPTIGKQQKDHVYASSRFSVCSTVLVVLDRTFLFYFLSLDLSFEVHNVYTAINNDGSIFCFLSVSGGFALTFAEHELVENKGPGLTSVKG